MGVIPSVGSIENSTNQDTNHAHHGPWECSSPVSRCQRTFSSNKNLGCPILRQKPYRIFRSTISCISISNIHKDRHVTAPKPWTVIIMDAFLIWDHDSAWENGEKSHGGDPGGRKTVYIWDFYTHEGSHGAKTVGKPWSVHTTDGILMWDHFSGAKNGEKFDGSDPGCWFHWKTAKTRTPTMHTMHHGSVVLLFSVVNGRSRRTKI